MNAPVPETAEPAAVPPHEQIAALAGAVLVGDLSAAQRALLARLVDEVGTSVRVGAKLADQLQAPVWDPVVEAYAALLAEVSR